MGFRHQAAVVQVDLMRGDAHHRLAHDVGRQHVAEFGRRGVSPFVPCRELFLGRGGEVR